MNLQFKLSDKLTSLEEVKIEVGSQKMWDKKGTPLRDIVLEKIAKIFGVKSINQEKLMDKLINLLNESEIIELMYLNLSAFDKDISSDARENSTLNNLHAFGKKINDQSKDVGVVITGLAFIFKFSEKTKTKFKIKKDSIVINCNLSFQKIDFRSHGSTDEKVWFEITRIESLDFYNQKNNSPSVKDVTKLLNNIEFVENWPINKIQGLNEFTDEFVQLFRTISRSQILTSRIDDGMNLFGWKDFVNKFKSYLIELKKGSMTFSVFSENEVEFGDNETANLLIMHDAKISVSPGKYKIISSEREDVKSTIKVLSIDDFDILKFINAHIKDKQQVVSATNQLITISDPSMQSLSKSLLNKKTSLLEFNKKIDALKDDKHAKETAKQDFDNEIIILKKNIKKLEDKNPKINHLEDKNNSHDSNKKLALITENNNNIANFNQQILKLEQQSRSIARTIKDLDAAINQIKNEITFVENQTKDITNQFNQEKKRYENLIEKMKETELSIKHDNQFIDYIQEANHKFKKVKIRLNANDEEEKSIYIDKIHLNFLKDKKYQGKCVWKLSDFDQGLFTKFNRYQSAITMLEKGIYRNPYLANALEFPDSINIIKQNEYQINKTQISLNENQLKAVEVGLKSSSLSYLQGPPGTGKTQTIAAITGINAKKGDNTLITSFSHEAINNAFDRLHESFKADPNIIFYKNTFVKNKQTDNPLAGYDCHHMYQNFINAIDNFILRNTNKNGFDNEIIFLNNFLLNNTPQNFTPTFLFKIIEAENFSKYKIKNYKWIYPDIVANKIEEELQYDLEVGLDGKETLKNHFTRLNLKYRKDIEDKINLQLDHIITSLTNVVDLNDEEITSIETIINSLIKKFSNNQKKQYEQKIQSLQKLFNDQINDQALPKSLVNKFANVALENQLINVIGITTTGNQVISYLNNTKTLFVDYPINFEIIDEVSKSTTIEILNTALLAEKIMLAGDYRQLPPNLSDIDENILLKFYEWAKSKYSKDPNFELDFEAYYQKISKLFVYPLFKKHAQKLKKKSTNAAYQFLNIQHRFNNDIMQLVNCVYDEDEKLKMPDYKIKDLKVKIVYDKTYDNAVNIIDTSFLTQAFIGFVKQNTKHHNLPAMQHNNRAFDQKKSLLTNYSPSSAFNEFNAFAILDLIQNIKNNNPNINGQQIGIIAITRSQVNVIKDFLWKGISDQTFVKQIKIDTVDNFQGRENDIIIVDLVRAPNLLDENLRIIKPAKRNLDFYNKIERLNVAVSRAKHKLILVGSVEDYFRKDVIPKIDDVNGMEKPLNIFNQWYDMIEDKEGTIRLWTI